MATAVPASAQNVTKLVVPYAPGGALDVLARHLAPQLSSALGETVIVENLTGANGINATKIVASSAPNGNTILFASTSQLAVNYHVSKALTFDPASTFQVLGTVSKVPHVLVVRANTFVNWNAIQKKGRSSSGITYGTPGVGSTNHLTGALLAQVTGLELVHVPYRGSGPAIADLLGGQIDMMIDQVSTSLPHIKAGRFYPIAVTSASRLPSLPDTPTLKELGVAIEPVVAWNALVAVKGLSPSRMNQLKSAIERATQSPEFQRAVAAGSLIPWTDSAASAEQFVQQENKRWAKLIREKNIQVLE